MVERVLVATNRSETAVRAVTWAATMAERFDADLLVVQVVSQPPSDGQPGRDELEQARLELARETATIAGPTARSTLLTHDDPARAIVDLAAAENVDLIVVGSVGMRDRTEFLLANVPNRVSHLARCSVVIIHDGDDGSDGALPGGDAHAGAGPGTGRRPLAPGDEPGDERLLPRAAHVGAVLARLGVRHVFGDPESTEGDAVRAEARRLRAALEELGPTFAKLGQLLSTRADLLPPAFIDELASLRDQVPALTEAEVVSVMEEELGVPWEDVFETIDREPLAAGTIGQVHRATLAGGERVVVKVQRPTARDDILTDLALLDRFARKTEHRPGFGAVADVPAIVGHLSDSLRRELDFRQEGANIERLRKALAPFPRLDVPRLYDALSTTRLLVMEDIQGVPVAQAPDTPARREAGRQLLESYYQQILTEGFFHADPHPGNLLWWKDTVYFLDCGMVGEVGPEVRQLLTLLLLAFWQQDAPFLAEVLLVLAGEEHRDDINLAALTDELADLMARYRQLSLRDIELGAVLQEITEISLHHAIRLPAPLVLAGKALAQMQLATAELDPTIDVLSVAGSFLLRSVGGRLRKGLDPKHVFYEAQKLQVRANRVIEAVERLVGARPGPKLQVHFRGMESLEGTVRSASRHLALALTASGALVGAAITASSHRVARWVPVALGSTGGALTTGLVADLLRPRRR